METRERLRAERIPQGYSGPRHLATTTTVTLLVVLGCLSQVAAPTWAELATVPATFLFANLAEYLGHRFVMHVPRPGLRAIWRRHALEHHSFFRADHMAVDTPRDYQLTLFPPILMAFFFGGFGAPPALALALLAAPNVGWLYAATAGSYFLLYEWLHLAWHAPEGSRLRHLPGYATLRALHRAHHDPALMSRANFNITFPLMDLLFGTWRPDR